MPGDNYLDVIKQSTIKTSETDLPDYNSGKSSLDNSPTLAKHFRLLESPDDNQTPVIASYPAEGLEKKKFKYSYKVKIFCLASANARDEYEQLMNSIWNEVDKYEQSTLDKNWDKSGALTIVVQYVLKEEIKEEKKEEELEETPVKKIRRKARKTTIEKVKLEEINNYESELS